jgi:sugar/nucleoside kinase (ribokinase family)
MSLLVVGSVALDDIEAPAGNVKGVLGGAASYFGVAASFFVPVRVVAVVGEDFPEEHLRFLRARGLDLTGVQRVPGRTFRWGGRYRASLNERDTLFTELGVFEHFDPKIPPAYRDSEWVFLANIQPTLQRGVLEQTRAPRFSAMDTMNFWITGARVELEKTLARVNGLVINDEEARQLTGESTWCARPTRSRARPERRDREAGEHGALLFDDAGVFAAPPSAARGQDPTGAGDSFAGG